MFIRWAKLYIGINHEIRLFKKVHLYICTDFYSRAVYGF